MDFRDYATTEASAFVERLVAVSDAAIQEVRGDAHKELEPLREQVDSLRANLETEIARAAALEADLDAVIDAHRQVDGERLKAEDTIEKYEEDMRGLRDMVESARAEALRNAEALEAESAQRALSEESHEEIVRQLQAQVKSAHAAEATLKAQLADAEARIQAIALESQAASQQLMERFKKEVDKASGRAAEQEAAIRAKAGEEIRQLHEQLEAAQLGLQTQAENARRIEARLHESEATVSSLRKQVEDANAVTDSTHAEMATTRNRTQRVTAMMTASVKALDALGAGTTVADVFRTLVQQLSTEFQRVAIFRVKGNHLEGEYGVGVDEAVDITKLVIPMGLDSVIAKAANGGKLAEATGRQLADTRPPFGGTPASALAAPLLFQGETIAVVYADSDGPPNEAHASFAGVLARYTNALLSRLAQELKTTKELTDYAAQLLEETEQMFEADMESEKPEQERIRRLYDNLQSARQLYTQRAEVEGEYAANLLEQRIATAVNVEPPTFFARDLAVVTGHTLAKRNAS